jgi:hypothetical protein
VTLHDGLYCAKFETSLGAAFGVLVVTGERLCGGDESFAYFGTQWPMRKGFMAKLETMRHADGQASVFSREPAQIHLVGQLNSIGAVCTGTAAGDPGLIFKVVLKFITAW